MCAEIALAEGAGPSPATHCAAAVKRYADGTPSSCQIGTALMVGGIEIPAYSDMIFNADGQVGGAWLGKDGAVYGQPLPKGTVLFFASGGRLRHFWLPRDSVLQGHLVRGQDDGAGNRLHPNGKLLAIWLAQDEVIDGVPCSSSGNVLRMGLGVIHLGTQRMAWFYDTGRLQQAMLAHDFTLQGHHFTKGEVISLDPDGRPVPGAKKLFEW
jgi:hypothetical protein